MSKAIKFSNSAVKSAYERLMTEGIDSETGFRLIAQSCQKSVEDVKALLNNAVAINTPLKSEAEPAPEEPLPEKKKTEKPKSPPTGRIPITIAPSPSAMLALRRFALRDNSFNATILATVHLNKASADQVIPVLQKHDFKVMPPHERRNKSQRAIISYIATVLEVRPENLCCGVLNVLNENSNGKVGRISSPGMPLDDAAFERSVETLRSTIKKHFPKSSFHFLGLPPLDLECLTTHAKTMVIGLRTPSERSVTVEHIDHEWLRKRCRDMVFVGWLQRTFPNGGVLDEVIAKIEFADWLISLLSYSRYPPHTPDGKMMLVRLAILCAKRAQRWFQDELARESIEATEAWLDDPTPTQAEKASKVADRVFATSKSERISAKEQGAYIRQAVRESAVRAAKAAHAERPSDISTNAARATASAIMAASFGANQNTSDSWLAMVGPGASPDEAAENIAICNEFRKVIQ